MTVPSEQLANTYESEITLNRRADSPIRLRRITTSSSLRPEFYSSRTQPNFFLTLCLLVLLGTRPKRLQMQLESDDPKTWDTFRDSLIRRWGTLGITSGLVLSAATTMLFSDRVGGAALVAAFTSLCGAIVSITFGTALAFVFTDAPAHDFRALAMRPMHMVFLLSIPNLFAMGSMVALYISITIFAWTFEEPGVATVLARVGTTAGALIMLVLFVYASWLVQDMGKRNFDDDQSKSRN